MSEKDIQQASAVPTAHVLVIEDSLTQAQRLRLHLESAHFAVEVVDTGERALERFQQDRFDLVISDIVMPGMDGFEVCRRIKALATGKTTPVILLTALSDPLDIVKGLEAGANNFITKPCERDYLIARITGIFNSQRARTASRTSNNLVENAATPAPAGVKVFFLGNEFTVTSEKEQILDFLVSTFEDYTRTKQREEQTHLEMIKQRYEADAGRLREDQLRKEKEEQEKTATALRKIVRELNETKGALQEYATQVESKNTTLVEYAVALEKATHAKSEFLATMSHELRTPLNAVIGFSEGLLERADRHPLNEHQTDRLTKINLSGHRLLTLINDVLDIAKIEAGEMRLQIDQFEIDPIAQEVRDNAGALARNKPDLQFVLDVEENLPHFTSDRGKIRQILLNLVSNAITFTERGSVGLRIRRDGETILMSVEDTGAGIPAEHLDRVFDKFYQVDHGPHRSVKGTGLGLSICSAFAELLGGAISVRSVVGQGSVFTLSLPLVLQESAARPNSDPMADVIAQCRL